MFFNIPPTLVLISNNVLYFDIERFGVCLLVLQLLLTVMFSLGWGALSVR